MKKIIQLVHGSIFASEKGVLSYLTNAQLSKTETQWNAKTEQNEVLPDPAMLKLRKLVPVEAEISAVLADGAQYVKESVAEEKVEKLKAKGKASKKPVDESATTENQK